MPANVCRVSGYSAALRTVVRGEPCRGMVHSVFRAAANLYFAPELFIALNVASTPALPNGIQLTVPPGVFPFSSLRVGLPVLLGGQRLVVDALNLSLDLSTCGQWSPAIIPAEAIDRSLLALHLVHLAGYISEGQPLPLDIASPEALASTYAGRGSGLTPEGDDLLLGWMAASWWLYGAQPAFGQTCRRIVEIARARTHALSLCWLRHAALGEVALPLKILVEALADTTGELCEQQAQIVLGIGSTSGQQMLRGVCLALKAYPQRWMESSI